MKKLVIFIASFFMCIFYSSAYSANWDKDGKVTPKEWDGKKPIVFGYISYPPSNNNGCDWEGDRDLALNFDISMFSHLAGSSFDVNNIHVDGIASGEWALFMWLNTWFANEWERAIPSLNGNNWGNRSIVSFCVGVSAQAGAFGGGPLENIIFWYDGDVQTTCHSSPVYVPSSTCPADKADTSTVAGSLAASNSGRTASDVTGFGSETVPTDSKTPGLPNFIGKKVELSNYNPKRTDSIQIYADSKNTGANGIDSDDEIEGRYFLSKGYKEDPHSEWIGIGKKESNGFNLELGESHERCYF
ncbi:MAG: hypothetical protein RBR97_16785 [Bacteroidales bacterium]|jgi:hypothetical protein|nr:hypothetical protein [Bacteroidales bacterium]